MRIVFDLDGTLCFTPPKTDGGWDYEKAEPFTNRIEIVNDLFDKGNYIIIDTARGSWSGNDWTEKTKSQVESWGLKFHELCVGKKIYADLFVDDRAVNSEQYFKDVREL